MKKMITLVLVLFVLSLCAVANAKPHYQKNRHNHNKPRYNWSQPAYHKYSWRQFDHKPLPFQWYQHRRYYTPQHYRMEYVNDREWSKRFPGLRAYKWRDHGPGFSYRGRQVKDAVLFYNDDDELVSYGFMHNGRFMFVRDDDYGYDSNDSFFVGWWNR